MAIKNILLHLAEDSMNATRQQVGIALAERLKAHLTAMYIMGGQESKLSVGRGASLSYNRAMDSVKREQVEALAQGFEKSLAERQIAHRVAIEEGNSHDLLEHHARAADLLIISQSEIAHLEDYFRHLFAEELVFTAGCPVLVLPKQWSYVEIGQHILLAWKPSREAVRALRDSLDFLKAAQRVDLLVVEGDEEDLPPDQVLAFLSRHGVEAELVKQPRQGKSRAEQLLAVQQERGADMLVAGARGRARVDEILLGNTTRKLMVNATCPLLLSC